MSEKHIDITPPGWKPPRSKRHWATTAAVVKSVFPDLKRLEVNQWGRLVVVVRDDKERSQLAMGEVYAADLRLFREQLDQNPEGFDRSRSHAAQWVAPQHQGVRELPPPPPVAPQLEGWATLGLSLVDGEDPAPEASEVLELLSQDELERRGTGWSQVTEDPSVVSCRHCGERAHESIVVQHTDSCPMKPIIDEYLRRERAEPFVDKNGKDLRVGDLLRLRDGSKIRIIEGHLSRDEYSASDWVTDEIIERADGVPP